jgi:2-oxoglutarate dehydrogenase E1 component
MNNFSYIFNAHPSYIEGLYLTYKSNPDELDSGWKLFFEGFEFGGNQNGIGNAAVSVDEITKEFGVLSIIHGFRQRGHLLSTTNPIKKRKDRLPHLDLTDYMLDETDLDRVFRAGEEIGMNGVTLRQILERLRLIYCGNLGVEFSHIENREKRLWLRDKIENRNLNEDFGHSIEKKKRILEKLNGSVVFENFLHTKFIGQKRFSLEGGETTIPALDAIINKAAEYGVKEVVIGMAHRGRLNVLVNTLGKTYEQIFTEFEGDTDPDHAYGDGDVKYHLGFSSQIESTSGAMIDIKMVPNPSHLEAVNPVMQGFSRSKSDVLYDYDYTKVLPLTIHGDAAVAGQGVVYETVQLSQLKGYYTGGTIHFVINNQIGFTTDYDDARSSTYCTAAAALVQAPVFHVNGDDPEAVVFAAELAMEYRQKFNNDVFVDMVCYRRHGHNEGDDPKFTQPHMYSIINKHPNPREIYAKRLIERSDIEKQLAEDMENSFWNNMQSRMDSHKENPLPYKFQEPEQAWINLNPTNNSQEIFRDFNTAITSERLDALLTHLMSVPDGFKPLSKVWRLKKGWSKMIDEGVIDWAFAELAAYGSVLQDGKDVRFSGQDVKRGTFSHRHAVFHDEKTYEEYNRLNTLEGINSRFMIYNSLLSEFAVMGFEYGYSLGSPNTLVLWEAQFGDFYNGAQTIIDQFVSAAESKWQRNSGLVLLLPHGMEGQGPEHSSARLERFLLLCAEFNIIVANVTTPANLFHLLRRQLAMPFRKPLVVMSPKSMLRHPRCISPKKDFLEGSSFQDFYPDTEVKASKVIRVLMCSGKVYYDLLQYREEHKIDDTAIIRVEQLYPLNEQGIRKEWAKYSKAEYFWVQEESANMGAWPYLLNIFRKDPVELISRKASASPATGFKKVHDRQQSELLQRAFGK